MCVGRIHKGMILNHFMSSISLKKISCFKNKAKTCANLFFETFVKPQINKIANLFYDFLYLGLLWTDGHNIQLGYNVEASTLKQR